jgi:hypothetical protein
MGKKAVSVELNEPDLVGPLFLFSSSFPFHFSIWHYLLFYLYKLIIQKGFNLIFLYMQIMYFDQIYPFYYTFLALLSPLPTFLKVFSRFHYAIFIHTYTYTYVCVYICIYVYLSTYIYIYALQLYSLLPLSCPFPSPTSSPSFTNMSYYFFMSRFDIWMKIWNICLSELSLAYPTWWSPVPSIFP